MLEQQLHATMAGFVEPTVLTGRPGEGMPTAAAQEPATMLEPSTTPRGRCRRAGALLAFAIAVAGVPVVAAEDPNDQAALLIRQASRSDSPAAAQAQLRQALALIEGQLGSEQAWRRRRSCFDRIVALSRLGLYAQTLSAETLACSEDAPLPAYVLSALGDAEAGRAEPERALQHYRAALALDPQDDAAFAGQIFALADLGRSAEAEALIEQRLVERDTRNDQLRRQLIRAWSGWTDAAAAAVADLAAAAPEDAELARQQAGLELLRDRPQAALAAYDRALQAAPGFVAAALARVNVLDRLGRRAEAEAVLAGLAAEAPDWPPLLRLQQQRRRERSGAYEGRVRGARGGDREIAAGEVRSEHSVSSPLLAGDVRAYLSHRRAYADFRGAALEDERLVAGLRWIRPGWRLQLELDDARDRLVADGGWAAALDARPSDDWSWGLSYADNAFDLPLRARGSGVVGDRYGAAVRYSPVGQGWLRLSAGLIDYSDGNQRRDLALGGFYRQPLSHRWSLELAPGLAFGSNRRDDVGYFSPRRDASVELLAALDHSLSIRLGHRHSQRFEAWLGGYDQHAVDPAAVGGLRYEYRIGFAPGRSGFLRLGRDRRSYDGVAEYQSFIETGVSLAW